MGKFTAILLQISLVNLVYSTQIQLLNFIKAFKGEIATRHNEHCASWIITVDYFLTYKNTFLEDESEGTTVVVADLIANNKSLDEPKFKFEPLRYHQPCSLVSINLTAAEQKSLISPLSSCSVISKKLPGHPNNVYHLIWLQPSAPQELSNVTANLVTLPNAFILLEQDDQVTILTRNLNPNLWYEAGTYNQRTSVLSLGIQELDFQGSPVLAIVCAVCANAVETYKIEGIWRDPFLATIYIFTTEFNGTLEAEGVFGLPQDGMNEDGEWDDFVNPTIDGTAVFATLVKLSYENQRIVYHSAYMYFDSVTFVTARPKRIQYSVIQKLYQPLSSTVWWSILISFVAVVASVEMLIHSSLKLMPAFDNIVLVRSAVVKRALGTIRKERREKHEHAYAVHAILEPLVEQSGLRSPVFCNNIRHVSTRIVVGLWFLLVIVINNGYKSVMTSLMVRPAYSRPPTTFRELLASDYHIGCVLFEGTIDVNLETLNNSWSRQLLQRIQPYSYFEPECYRVIFERESACIGVRQVFNVLGPTFMVDVHYRSMAQFSKEDMFPIVLGMGVSLHYPALLEPLNHYIAALSETGIYKKWWDNGIWYQEKQGQANAVYIADVKKYYLGLDESAKESSVESLGLFIQVFGYGILVGISGFMMEIVYNFVVKRFMQ